MGSARMNIFFSCIIYALGMGLALKSTSIRLIFLT